MVQFFQLKKQFFNFLISLIQFRLFDTIENFVSEKYIIFHCFHLKINENGIIDIN